MHLFIRENDPRFLSLGVDCPEVGPSGQDVQMLCPAEIQPLECAAIQLLDLAREIVNVVWSEYGPVSFVVKGESSLI